MSNKEIETEKNSEKETSGTKENSTARNILGTIAYIAGVCIFVFLILHFVGQRTVVNGNSMDTTLANGQNLVMDKLSYRFHDPKRYDIIIFPGPEEEGMHPYYIKRIIGMPGETRHGGYYYLFGSNGTCCEGKNSTYQVVYGRSESLFGPYLTKNGVDMKTGAFEILLPCQSVHLQIF